MSNSFQSAEEALIEEGALIGKSTRIWHWSHVCRGAKIGEGCNIGQNVYISSKVQIGNYVKIQNNVSLYDGIIVKDYAFLGPSVVFTNVLMPRSEFPVNKKYVETTVGRGASIGANSTIVCGNIIEKYAMIGAGSVVTRDVGAYELVVGVPARRIGWVSRGGIKIPTSLGGVWTCPISGESYIMRDDQLRVHGE